MKKNTICQQMILWILVVLMMVFPVFAEPTEEPAQENTFTPGCFSVDATQQLIGSELKMENAGAAFLYETTTQTLMYALNPDAPVYPSSLVKIMTALLVVEMGDLTETVTIRQSTLDSISIGAASAKLLADENITLGDLLYCMTVGSANDAAAAMAEHISGTQSAFVELMNKRAEELGCTATTFVNVHGLHHEQQISTVRDVAKILVAAMENELFRAVFSAASYTVPATNLSEQRHLSTSNYLVLDTKVQYYDPRVTGGRTGIANDGTRCLATVAEKDGMTLISVLTGARSETAENGSVQVYGGFKETKALLDAGFTGYKPAQILYEGQVMAQRNVTDGANRVSIGPSVGLSTVLPAQVTFQDLSFRYEDGGNSVMAPVKTGDRVTGVEIWYGGLCVAKTDLYALNDVGVGASFTHIQGTGNGGKVWKTVVLVLVVLACLAVLGLILVRFAGKMRLLSAKRRSKRRRQSRRRS